jgi:hypothetical protein
VTELTVAQAAAAAADWQRLVAGCSGAWFSHNRDWCALVDADQDKTAGTVTDASFVVTRRGGPAGSGLAALVPCAASARAGGSVVSGLIEPSGPMLSDGLSPDERAAVWGLIDRQLSTVARDRDATSIVLRFPVLVSSGPRAYDDIDRAALGELGYRLRTRRFYYIDLTRTEAALWQGVSSRMRTQIRAAMRSCQVIEATGEAELARLCELFREQSAAKGTTTMMTPGLISRLARGDSGLVVRPLLATGEAGPAAFALSFGIGRCASLFAWGSTAAALPTQLPKLIVWQALLDLKARGMHWAEYGGAITDMSIYAGLTEFYRRIGGQVRESLLAYRITG